MHFLKTLLQKIKPVTNDLLPFDPASLNDPVAMQTDWTPKNKGGANFLTHKLVAIRPNRLEFKASFVAKLFYGVFLVAGIGVLVRFLFDGHAFVSLLGGLIFAGAGGFFLYTGTQPIVFDKEKGLFWKGRPLPVKNLNRNTLQSTIQLKHIHALQIIMEYQEDTNDSQPYYSYELNLVLDDSQRINVVDHGDAERLKKAATALADFLEKPVWDAT